MDLTDLLPDSGDATRLEPFLDRAAAWATGLTLEDVPRPVREAAPRLPEIGRAHV